MTTNSTWAVLRNPAFRKLWIVATWMMNNFAGSRLLHFTNLPESASTVTGGINDKVYVNQRRMLEQRALMVDAMYTATLSMDVLDVGERSAT
jgi:hypothetical protein